MSDFFLLITVSIFMEKFSSFFNSSKETSTPNTRKHSQNAIRSITRKHQNQVPRMYGNEGKKAHPLIDSIVKNNKHGQWNISPLDGQNIVKTYGINHNPNKSYTKDINKTNISINYDANTKKFTLSRFK